MKQEISDNLADEPFYKKFFSRRWEMVFLLFSGLAVVYTLRVNISVAAQKMRDELEWSESQKGLVLSAFYWGYSAGQIPASRLIQRFGAKWIFGFSILIPSVLTLLVPAASRHSFGLALFIRCIIGFFESASFPAVYHFFPFWVPINEKTFMIPSIVSGMYMGEIIGFSLAGVLVESTILVAGSNLGGWPSVFYVFGTMGIVWFPFFAIRAYESPATHPKITLEEILLINEGKAFAKMPDNADHPIARKSPSFAQSVTLSTSASPMQTEQDFRRSISLSGDGGHAPVFVAEKHGSLCEQKRSNSTQRYAALTTSDQTNALLNPSENVEEEEDDEDIRLILSDKEKLAERTPWLAFVTHPVALTLFLNSWANGWIGFTLLSEMPSYLTDVLGFDLTSAGILCVFPYLTLFLANLGFGALFLYFQNDFGWSTDRVRQVAQWVCIFGSSMGLILCSFMEDKYVAYVFMILTQLLYGAGQCGLGCAYSDNAPNYSSALNSIGNTISAVAGIVGPIAVAAFISDYPDPWGWRGAFFLTMVISVLALITWSIYQTSLIVPELNMPRKGKRLASRTDAFHNRVPL